MNNTPYSTLSPDLILNAVDSIGFRTNGSLLALNSYENRVYQIGMEDAAPMIAKFYRPHRWSNETILEEHQFELELVEHEIPVVAPWQNEKKQTLFEFESFRFSLFPRYGGHALELDQLEQLEWMGRFIGRMHAVSSTRPFLHRPSLNVQTHGHGPYRYLIEHNFIPDYLKVNYVRTIETALKKIEERFASVGHIETIRLHGDIHPGNILWRPEGPHIIDLDDCVSGPAMQDIWMMLSGNENDMQLQLEHILRGYRAFHDFNYRELQLTEALRTLRQIQYSAWLASRWNDPAFPPAFPWFNTPNYWQEQIVNLNEQITLLEESPL